MRGEIEIVVMLSVMKIEVGAIFFQESLRRVSLFFS